MMGVRGQSRTEIAQKELAHGYQWNSEGHPDAIPREQVKVKSKDRRAKTECQSREEWSPRPQPWSDGNLDRDNARTSQPAGHCRVEEQAPVEQGAEVED